MDVEYSAPGRHRRRAPHPRADLGIATIVLSASDEPNTSQRAFEAGATGYLTKDKLAYSLVPAVLAAAGAHARLSGDGGAQRLQVERESADFDRRRGPDGKEASSRSSWSGRPSSREAAARRRSSATARAASCCPRAHRPALDPAPRSSSSALAARGIYDGDAPAAGIVTGVGRVEAARCWSSRTTRP